MFDFNFDWKPELNTNIQNIDQQHKELFRIGRDMEQLLRFKCIGVEDRQLLDIVCDLRNFTSYHFYEEERLMREAGYSNIEKHIEGHKQLTKIITGINMPKMKENPNQELGKLRDNLVDWIFMHLLTEDLAMAKEIRGKVKYDE